MMKPVIKTASALLFMATFAACTHYTLPEDPVDQQINTANQAQSAAPVQTASVTPAVMTPQTQAQAMRVADTAPVPQGQAAPQAAMPAQPKMETPVQAQTAASQECTGQHYIDVGGKPVNMVKVRATGYGAPPKSFYSDPQRRLMAMRAAKVDAYRSLAERINGVQIWGGTTLGDMVVEKDRFRVYLDTHLRGARVIAENPHEDGSFETIVEVSVGQQMLTMALPARNDCVEPSKPHQQAQKADYIFSSASLSPMSRNDDAQLSNSNF